MHKLSNLTEWQLRTHIHTSQLSCKYLLFFTLRQEDRIRTYQLIKTTVHCYFCSRPLIKRWHCFELEHVQVSPAAFRLRFDTRAPVRRIAESSACATRGKHRATFDTTEGCLLKILAFCRILEVDAVKWFYNWKYQVYFVRVDCKDKKRWPTWGISYIVAIEDLLFHPGEYSSLFIRIDLPALNSEVFLFYNLKL